MRYWRTMLVGIGYRYARVHTSGTCADRLDPGSTEWVRDDQLVSEVRFTGNWDPATEAEVTEALDSRAAAARA